MINTNILGLVTVVFLLITENNETFKFKLVAEHDNDVILLNLLSVNLKFTCNIFVHKLFWHVSCLSEFELVDKDINEFVSYNAKFTSGFELMDAHTIWYVLFDKSFAKFIVWFEKTVEPLKNIFNIG